MPREASGEEGFRVDGRALAQGPGAGGREVKAKQTAEGAGPEEEGLGFRVQGSGFRVQGLGV